MIVARRPSEHWEVVEISLPAALARYVVEKGSIAVDGVSLTVVQAGADRFTVSLIPTTLAATTLGRKQAGDPVNLEVDIIAKHVERLLGTPGMSTETPAGRGGPAGSDRARRLRSCGPGGPSWWSTTRTARTRATWSSPPARRRPPWSAS